jgi:hypothetical protein
MGGFEIEMAAVGREAIAGRPTMSAGKPNGREDEDWRRAVERGLRNAKTFLATQSASSISDTPIAPYAVVGE